MMAELKNVFMIKGLWSEVKEVLPPMESVCGDSFVTIVMEDIILRPFDLDM